MSCSSVVSGVMSLPKLPDICTKAHRLFSASYGAIASLFFCKKGAVRLDVICENDAGMHFYDTIIM